MMTNYEIVVIIGAVVMLVIGVFRDYKNSKRGVSTTLNDRGSRPEGWDKSFEK